MEHVVPDTQQIQQAVDGPRAIIRGMGGAVAAACGVSGFGWILWGFLAAPRFVWWFTAFEAMVVLAGAMGAQLLRPHWRGLLPLVLACISGTILVASVLGYLALRSSLLDETPSWMRWALQGRVAAGVVIGVLAGAAALGTRRSAWLGVVRGAILLAVAGGLAGLDLWLLKPVLAATGGTKVMIHLTLATLVFVAFAGFFAAGVHSLIRSFDPAEVQAGKAGSQQDPA